MIQPIQPTGSNPSSQAGAISMNSSASSVNISQSIRATTPISQSMQITNINTAVTKMLQDIGGGVEDNKVLQLLIALLILMALLQNLTPQEGGQSGGGSGGGSSEQNAAQLLSLTMSSSSISIEQTSISITNTTSISTYDASGEQSQASGQQLDIGA